MGGIPKKLLTQGWISHKIIRNQRNWQMCFPVKESHKLRLILKLNTGYSRIVNKSNST